MKFKGFNLYCDLYYCRNKIYKNKIYETCSLLLH